VGGAGGSNLGNNGGAESVYPTPINYLGCGAGGSGHGGTNLSTIGGSGVVVLRYQL
jgi:hypothetical protein